MDNLLNNFLDPFASVWGSSDPGYNLRYSKRQKPKPRCVRKKSQKEGLIKNSYQN